MDYLVIKDMDTDEENNRIELSKVRNVSCMSGFEVNQFSFMYWLKADNFKHYMIIQYDTGDDITGFIPFEVTTAYITFE